MVSKELADWYFQDGRAALAACCHLAVDNIEVQPFKSVYVNGNLLSVCHDVGGEKIR